MQDHIIYGLLERYSRNRIEEAIALYLYLYDGFPEINMDEVDPNDFNSSEENSEQYKFNFLAEDVYDLIDDYRCIGEIELDREIESYKETIADEIRYSLKNNPYKDFIDCEKAAEEYCEGIDEEFLGYKIISYNCYNTYYEYYVRED